MRTVLAALLVPLIFALAPANAAVPASEFIGDMPKLTSDTQRPAAQVFVAPGQTLKGYDRVSLDPVLIWFAPDSKYRGVEPNELAAVANDFREILIDRLEPRYAVIKGAGERALGVRVAITNIMAQKHKRGLLGYTPAGLVVGAVKDSATAGPNIDLRAAWIEAELLDAKGQRIAVIMEPLVAADAKKANLTWKQIGQALDAWAERLRARLDAENAS